MQHRSAAIINSQHILQLATILQVPQQQAAAAADTAEQYAAAGDLAAAKECYAQCLQTCSAAVNRHTAGSSGSNRWVLEVLARVIPPAVDVQIALVRAAGTPYS